MTGSDSQAPRPDIPRPDAPDRAAMAEQVAAFLKEAAEQRTAETGVEAPQPLPRTEAAFLAAVCDTFVVEDLKADPASQEVRAILMPTELVIAGGQRRLRLTDEARGRFLDEVRELPAFRKVLDDLLEMDRRDFDAITNDPIRLPSAWLRSFLADDFADLDKAPASELRAAVSALERLRHARLSANTPSLPEALRLLNLAELLEPLRILIGVTGGWDDRRAKDRFSGRSEERRLLRGFVDVLRSEGVYERIQRATAWALEGVSAAITGRSTGVLVIAARGGLGKTALIAKFVLDHALAQERPFPFAYLDFDRWALQPREPRLLLVEVAGQVALQYPSLEPRLSTLRHRLRAAVVDPLAGDVEDAFDEFRYLVRELVRDKGLPFLLVLDTMEVVQYDPQALKGVTAFVDALFAAPFPELRVVAAGRADIPELRQATDTRAEGRLLPLKPLLLADAERMADRLGQGLLGTKWHSAWVRKVVGTSSHPSDRREPLSIRVAVELLRSADDLQAREALAAEIEGGGEEARGEFVAVLYEKRILHHVRDPDVRALAWPGLILRRVTREIVRDLLAEQCGLTQERAEAAFEGLAREAWIVQRRGEALYHHPDLRTRTLPLMRRHNPQVFADVNNAAIRYFHGRRERSPADRAEWLYHRLLGGEKPEEVELDWSKETGSLLAGAELDLPQEDTQAAAVLAVLGARTLLPAALIAKLPPRLALGHIARTAPELGGFREAKLQDVLLTLRLDEALDRGQPPMVEAAAVALAAKTGRWHAVHAIGHDGGAWEAHLDFVLRFCRTRMLGPALVEAPPGYLPRSASSMQNAFRLLVQDLVYSRLIDHPSFDDVDAQVTQILEKKPQWLGLHKAALRLVVGFGVRAFVPALQYWLQRIEAGIPRNKPMTLSLVEMNALSELDLNRAVFASLLKENMASDQMVAEFTQAGRPLRFQGGNIRPALSMALRIVLDNHWTDGARAVRRFALARDQDWLVPIAYAAARATDRQVPQAVLERLMAQDPPSQDWSVNNFFRRRPKLGNDILQLLRRADEASDLADTARLFLDAKQGDGEDLDALLKVHARWRKHLSII